MSFTIGMRITMWYVIWSVTGKEEKLLQTVKRKVPERLYNRVWVPYRIKISKFHGEERQDMIRLFPGYLLIDTEDPEKVHIGLRGEKDYIGILKSNDEFSPVSEEEKEIISYFTDNKGIAGVSLGIKENGRTKIIEGPLKGMDDKIIKVERNKKRAWISLKNFLGKDREIPFALEIIEKDRE